MVALGLPGLATTQQCANDYGTTRLCECAEALNTPAVMGKKIQCQLTKLKY